MNMKYNIAIIFLVLFIPRLTADIRNGGFQRRGGNPPDAATINTYRKNGIKNPDAAQWPQFWRCIGSSGTIEFPSTDGVDNGGFARFSGRNTILVGYHGEKLAGDFVLEIYLRGHGTVSIGFHAYGLDQREQIRFIPPQNAIRNISVDIDGNTWTRYCFPFKKPQDLYAVHLTLNALSGIIDADEISIIHPGRDLFLIADAENRLRREKIFFTKPEKIQISPEVLKIIDIFKKQNNELLKFTESPSSNPDAKQLLTRLKKFSPYVLTSGIEYISLDNFNRMLAFCYAIEQITGSKAAFSLHLASVQDTPRKPIVEGTEEAMIQKPLCFEKMNFGKILYEENENGIVYFALSNRTKTPVSGTLTIQMKSGINDHHVICVKKLTIPIGVNAYQIPFNVGPETFGREVELKFTSNENNFSISKKEYFQVAKEYMRVMMHGTSRYKNLHHYFAHEQTDFGIHPTNDQVYLAPQVRYKITKKNYRAQIQYEKDKEHQKISFYQNRSFAGQVGFEEVRQHPEFIIYDENGQPAADPFYGGLPNPFETAAPAEMEPARRKKLLNGRDFLDVTLSSWHHLIADLTNPDCIIYGAGCIRKYQKEMAMDVVYFDDMPGVMPGYNYKGEYNLACKSREDIAKMNASIARLWNAELRKDNPNAGSWCNGALPPSTRWYRGLGMWERTMGLGIGLENDTDVSDVYIRALTEPHNSMFLAEIQHVFDERSNINGRYPKGWLQQLLEQRDYLIQKYKANVVFGYIAVPSIPDISNIPENKWFWPTINYFQSLTVATQHHHILYCHAPGLPSMQPFDQFMTRYSALLWDRELRVIPVSEVEKMIKVTSKDQLLYKDFVYHRNYENSQALIVHFVRPYPLEKWDLHWNVHPTLLSDVQVEFTLPPGKEPVIVKAMRPYLPNEKEEIIEHIVPFTLKKSKLSVVLPPFSYYSMVVVELK